MNSWGYITGGLICAAVSAFFLVFVAGHGPTGAGVILTVLFTGAALVLLPIGVIAEGVRIGNRDSGQSA